MRGSMAALPTMASPRHQAREAALQALYSWEVGGLDPGEALDVCFAEHRRDAPATVRDFAATLVHGVTADVGALDTLIQAHCEHWRVERLAVIDRLILRLATWELRHTREADLPRAVILNEALELARTFSTDDAVGFVNGVLDAIRRALGSQA